MACLRRQGDQFINAGTSKSSHPNPLSVVPFPVGAVTSPLWVPMMSPAFNGEALSRVEAPWVAHRVWPRTRRAVRRLLRNWWCPGRWVLNAPSAVRMRHRPSVCSRTAGPVCGRGNRARLCRVESRPYSNVTWGVLADNPLGELVLRVVVQVFRIDDAADFDRFGVHHNAAEAV